MPTPAESYCLQAVRHHFRLRHAVGGANFQFARKNVRNAIRIIRRERARRAS